MNRPRRLLPPLPHPASVALACLMGLTTGFSAHAAGPAEVLRLHQAGQNDKALKLADTHLTQHPQDAQMRFVRANLLNATGHPEQAQQALQALTREHPELPEPWNNLAVLHAATGQLEEAEQALHTALRLQPDYATALENLGDVQFQLALRHWQQALQHAPSNTQLKARIQALQTASEVKP